ncbi:hypothetical protein T265_06561 [Opisthorchis viverrini]|uniref:Uncharacterized protein n=1 Tax=Opisthorchis viverrini TaxID=6198 RepID=A0A074ZS47_OPIVI|nr:hypothetical protein T265_06561 [Opisthorchis viverrini]KER26150.1 hypothetical protein T265_06561 [Opisthorchis viverrini]
MQQNPLVAGSEGLKLLDALDGTVISVALTSVVGGPRSLCPLPAIDGRIISGGTEGLLYTCSLDHTKCSPVPNKEVRRCFVSSKLQPAQKTIIALVISPDDHNLLIAGCRGGTVKVLRTNSLLTTFQQFSVLNPTIAGEISNPQQLTGMCMASGPDWLSSLEAPANLLVRINQSSIRKIDQDRQTKHCVSLDRLSTILDDIWMTWFEFASLPQTNATIYLTTGPASTWIFMKWLVVL